MDIRTKAVHTGVYKDKSYNSVITPIYPSSTYYFDALGKNKGYDYSRSANPTRTALEENLADLEGGVGASATQRFHQRSAAFCRPDPALWRGVAVHARHFGPGVQHSSRRGCTINISVIVCHHRMRGGFRIPRNSCIGD